MIDAEDILATSAEHRLGMAIRQAFAGLDDIMAMAADPETKHLVANDIRLADQLVSRAQLIASFIQACRDQQGKIRMVVNRG